PSDQLIAHVSDKTLHNDEDGVLIERILPDPSSVVLELVHLAREVEVSPNPALTGELAKADRVVLGNAVPLVGRDVDKRAAAPENERRVRAARGPQLLFRQQPVVASASTIAQPGGGESRHVAGSPMPICARGEP